MAIFFLREKNWKHEWEKITLTGLIHRSGFHLSRSFWRWCIVVNGDARSSLALRVHVLAVVVSRASRRRWLGHKRRRKGTGPHCAGREVSGSSARLHQRRGSSGYVRCRVLVVARLDGRQRVPWSRRYRSLRDVRRAGGGWERDGRLVPVWRHDNIVLASSVRVAVDGGVKRSDARELSYSPLRPPSTIVLGVALVFALDDLALGAVAVSVRTGQPVLGRG